LANAQALVQLANEQALVAQKNEQTIDNYKDDEQGIWSIPLFLTCLVGYSAIGGHKIYSTDTALQGLRQTWNRERK